MNKEEYREEVIRQLEGLNEKLDKMHTDMCVIGALTVFLLTFIFIFSMVSLFSLGNIESYVDTLRDSLDPLNPLYDIKNSLKYIQDYVSTISWRVK